MKIAVISDIHSNIEALYSVSDQISNSMPILCLGDLVGYGASPNEVIDWVRDNVTHVIKGNHDESVITGKTPGFSSSSSKVILWTRNQLSQNNFNFLKHLPSSKHIKIGDHYLLIAHGSPIDTLNEYVHLDTHLNLFEYYFTRYNSNIIGLGHTHVPFKYNLDHSVIFNPGSIGQPRNGSPDSSYSIVDLSDVPKISLLNAKYNVDHSADKILQAGLPEYFAYRLYDGV